MVTSYVCQAILMPPEVTGAHAAVSSQPVSLGDHLLGERRGRGGTLGHWDTLGSLRHVGKTGTGTPWWH